MGHVHFDGQGGAGGRGREEVGKALPCHREGGERVSALAETRLPASCIGHACAHAVHGQLLATVDSEQNKCLGTQDTGRARRMPQCTRPCEPAHPSYLALGGGVIFQIGVVGV
jgi:hypothetical protein